MRGVVEELRPCSGIWNLVCVSVLAVVWGAGRLCGDALGGAGTLGLKAGCRGLGVEAEGRELVIRRAIRGRADRAERVRACCWASSIWVAICDNSQTNETNRLRNFWKRANVRDMPLESPRSLCRTPWLRVPFQHCSALSRWGEKEYLWSLENRFLSHRGQSGAICIRCSACV